MIEYKKATDNTHPIDLQSAINSVYWRADVICTEEEAFFDVVTELVSDNSQIEIDIKDADGNTIHSLKEKIQENFFKSSFKIPADASGELTINAKLPAHSLEKESAPVEILAQPEITNAKWAKTEAESAECIDFNAETKNLNEYSQVNIEVYKQENGKEELIDSFPVQVGQDKLEGTWQEEGECQLVETQEEADKLEPAEYFYKAKYKTIEAKSDALKVKNWIIQTPPPPITFHEFTNVIEHSQCTIDYLWVTCGHDKKEVNKRTRVVKNSGVLEIVADSGKSLPYDNSPAGVKESVMKTELFGWTAEIKKSHGGTDKIIAEIGTKNGEEVQEISHNSFPDRYSWEYGNKKEIIFNAPRQNVPDKIDTKDIWPWPTKDVAETSFISAKGADDKILQVKVLNYTNQQHMFKLLPVSEEEIKKSQQRDTSPPAELITKINELIGKAMSGASPVTGKAEWLEPKLDLEFSWGWKEKENNRTAFHVKAEAGMKPAGGGKISADFSVGKLLLAGIGIPPCLSDVATEVLGDINIGFEAAAQINITGRLQLDVYSNSERKVNGGIKFAPEGALKVYITARAGSEWLACVIVSGAGSGKLLGEAEIQIDYTGIKAQPIVKLNPILLEAEVRIVVARRTKFQGTKTWRVWDGKELLKLKKPKYFMRF